MAYLKSIEKKLPDISILQAIKNNVKPGIAGRC